MPTAPITRADVVAEALSWLGTPYHHLADVKGAGVDCAMLLVRVYAALGLIPADTDPRPYSEQWHLHHGEEMYLGWLQRHARFTDSPQPGDVAVWRFGRTYSHGGILVEPATVVHALKDSRIVKLHRVDEYPLHGRAVQYYTLFTPAP